MKYFCTLLIILLRFVGITEAQQLPEHFSNHIYKPNIETVRMNIAGSSFSNPILTLGGNAMLEITFDELTDDLEDYAYFIVHCDRNWKESRLSRSEYMGPFDDYLIDNYDYSRNTDVKYVNYYLTLPNDDIQFKYSGNYALVIYDRNMPQAPVLIRQFMVVENQVGIQARIKNAAFEAPGEKRQEIDFIIDHTNFPINNPRSDIQVIIRQNRRIDNQIDNIQPLFTGRNMLDYSLDVGNSFHGGNEFRVFDIRNYRYTSEGVFKWDYVRPNYHATLIPSELRRGTPYRYYQEMNGMYHIEATQTDYPDTEGDYVFVHFMLNTKQPLFGGGIFIFGEFNDWKCNERNQMKWDAESKSYHATILMKQGYYNYCYAWMDAETREVSTHLLEGSHRETENSYQIFVYYGKNTDRYDRLIGYGRFNSTTSKDALR